MTRIELIQKYIDENDYKTYLEIGTYKGYSFFPIRINNKIAVDPHFKIPLIRRWIASLEKGKKGRKYFFEMTSDSFFATENHFLKKIAGIDIVLVDGLHSFEASLRDVLNSLRYLNKDGVIVMHDCYPPNKAAAFPATSVLEAKQANLEGWTGTWCGDVWKTVAYLRKKYPEQLEVFTLNTDFGLGIIKSKIAPELLNLEIDSTLMEEMRNLEFERSTYLNSLIGLRNMNQTENQI